MVHRQTGACVCRQLRASFTEMVYWPVQRRAATRPQHSCCPSRIEPPQERPRTDLVSAQRNTLYTGWTSPTGYGLCTMGHESRAPNAFDLPPHCRWMSIIHGCPPLAIGLPWSCCSYLAPTCRPNPSLHWLRGCVHLCRVTGNTVWYHMASDVP